MDMNHITKRYGERRLRDLKINSWSVSCQTVLYLFMAWLNSLSSLLATECSTDVMTLGFILRQTSMISGANISAKCLTVFIFVGNTFISFSNNILAKAFLREGSSAWAVEPTFRSPGRLKNISFWFSPLAFLLKVLTQYRNVFKTRKLSSQKGRFMWKKNER